MSTATGAMKSLSSAPKEEEARLLTNMLPKALQPLLKTPAAERFTDASPNSPTPSGLMLLFSVSLNVLVLTFPSAKPAALRSTLDPQHGRALAAKQAALVAAGSSVPSSQVRRPRVGVPLPAKS